MMDGLFVPGSGLCYRVDSRVKLVLTLVLMVALFSSTTFYRPLLIVLAWFFCADLNRTKLKQLWALVGLLRWLLLFTLVLHLLLTPGRTLWGSAWLSYDGLLRGLLIDIQLLVAAALSLLLAWTTRPLDIARGGAVLLAPLQQLRVPVREIAELVPLVLYFIPALQEEAKRLRSDPVAEAWSDDSTWQRWIAKVEILIGRMLNRADDLACQLTAGMGPADVCLESGSLAVNLGSWCAALGGLVYCIILFQV
jgi:energy-coupling factor transport system permease protein